MYFSRMLANIAVALTIALGAPTLAFAAVSTPPTIPPAEAPVQASECITAGIAVESILKGVPDADIKDVLPEQNTIILTSPSMSTDLILVFDGEGCLAGMAEVEKVPSVGV